MRAFTLFIFTLIFTSLLGQQIENGSFEGEANGADVLAFPWSKCNVIANNTPDLYPGVYSNVTQGASDGLSYLNMVVRENGTKEMVYGQIVPPMIPNECYRISFDAMVSEQMVLESWGEVRDYTNPAGLAVDLGDAQCTPQITLISVEDLLPGSHWNRYSCLYQPTFDTHGIRLRNYFIGSDYYYGHVLVDNLTIQKSGDTTYMADYYVEGFEDIIISMPYEEGYSYNWESPIVTCPSCYTTVVDMDETTTIVGSRQDSTSCFVEFFSFNLISSPIVPNVFTPNGDHINDLFLIRNLPIEASLSIFNRWGNQVFYSGKYDNTWDGKHQGTTLPDGVYFYSLNYSEKEITGFFHILK